MHFDLATAVDIEPMRLLDKIEDTLMLGGWVEQPNTMPGEKFNRMDRPPVNERMVAGVWVLFPVKSGPQYESAAKALWDALNKQGIRGTPVSITGEQAYSLNAIHVWVGGKP
jgi:hypothetical protein